MSRHSQEKLLWDFGVFRAPCGCEGWGISPCTANSSPGLLAVPRNYFIFLRLLQHCLISIWSDKMQNPQHGRGKFLLFQGLYVPFFVSLLQLLFICVHIYIKHFRIDYLASFLQLEKKRNSHLPFPVIILIFGEICEAVAKKLTLAPMIIKQLFIIFMGYQRAADLQLICTDLKKKNLFSVKQQMKLIITGQLEQQSDVWSRVGFLLQWLQEMRDLGCGAGSALSTTGG